MESGGEILEEFTCLLNRTQIIEMNKVLSKRHEVRFSIPRGGVLGQTLFCTYINDLLFSKIKSFVKYLH